MNKSTLTLRELFDNEDIVIAPGAYDAFSGLLVQQAGFSLVYLSGSALAAASLGKPDVGLLTKSEALETARKIISVIDIPLLADLDQGYGNAIQLIHAIKDFEQIGLAGVQVEDQSFPKRCGHMENKEIVSSEEMIGKIKAILETRKSKLVVVARTDARSVIGIDEAIKRGNLYAEAGADLIFPEAPESRDELKLFAKEIHAPLVANMTEWGKTPLCSILELREMGYKLVLFPVSALRVSMKAISDFLADLRVYGSQSSWLDRMKTRQEMYEVVNYPEILELESRFLKKRTVDD